MPEGDTIHALANSLRPELTGREVVRLRLRAHGELRSLRGARVTSVEARGKHLLVGLDDRWTLRTWLGMKGAWHRYRRGERWRRPADDATVVLETAERVYVCFRAPDAEVFRTRDLPVHPRLRRLGPDLLGADDPDWDAVVARARRASGRRPTLGELLLDQGVAAGIGNVFKSEILFLERVHPDAPPEGLTDDALRSMYRLARRLLLQSIAVGVRVTVGRPAPGSRLPRSAPRLWVYDRAGLPCRECGARIRSAHQGDDARITYWCPTCQPRER